MPLTRERVHELLAEGLTQSAIARRYRVTRQAVSDLLRRPSGGKRGRPRKNASTVICEHCGGTGRVPAPEGVDTP